MIIANTHVETHKILCVIIGGLMPAAQLRMPGACSALSTSARRRALAARAPDVTTSPTLKLRMSVTDCYFVRTLVL